MSEHEQEKTLGASPSKLRVDAPSFSPGHHHIEKKLIPPVQTNFPKLYQKLDAVPFTPSQGVLSPTPSNMAALWYQHQHAYMTDSPNYHRYPGTPLYTVPVGPAAWPSRQVIQRSVSLGAGPPWPPAMHSAPASPVYAFAHGHMGGTWQLQPGPWHHSPHPMTNPVGGYVPLSPSHRQQVPPQPGLAMFPPAFQPPPPPVHVPVTVRPATSPAPLGASQHSPQHSDADSQWDTLLSGDRWQGPPSPASREAPGNSRVMNLEFVSALHHNHRAVGTAMQQLEDSGPEPVQTAVTELRHLMEFHGVLPLRGSSKGDTDDASSASMLPESPSVATKVSSPGGKSSRETRRGQPIAGIMQRSRGHVPMLNARARRTLKRALKRAVDELSAAGMPVRDALKPLPHSGEEYKMVRLTGDAIRTLPVVHTAQDVSSPTTVAARREASRDCESSGSSSPITKVAVFSHTESSEDSTAQSITTPAAQPPKASHLSSSLGGSELSNLGPDKAAEVSSSAKEVLGQPVLYSIDVTASAVEPVSVHCKRETSNSQDE